MMMVHDALFAEDLAHGLTSQRRVQRRVQGPVQGRVQRHDQRYICMTIDEEEKDDKHKEHQGEEEDAA